jgi:hypothetical protein
MAEVRVYDKSVRIADFAKDELDELVERLSTDYPELKVTDVAVLSALVLAAARSPAEAVAAVLGTYWKDAADVVGAVQAVGDFLRAASA